MRKCKNIYTMKGVICLCFLLGAASPVKAAFISDFGGVPNSAVDARSTLSRGSYDDFYTFTALANVDSAEFSFDLEPSGASWFQAGGVSFELYEGVSNPVGIPIARAIAGGGQNALSFEADLNQNSIYTRRTAFSFNTSMLNNTATATTSVDVPDNPTPPPVPVPAAMWLFMSALLGLVGIKRSRA
jgi:hypothetical protein